MIRYKKKEGFKLWSQEEIISSGFAQAHRIFTEMNV